MTGIRKSSTGAANGDRQLVCQLPDPQLSMVLHSVTLPRSRDGCIIGITHRRPIPQWHGRTPEQEHALSPQ